jgi:recombination associated protein RdgC
MWFKNLHVYKIPASFPFDAEQLAEKLESRRFKSCGRMVDKTLGWVSPIHRNQAYLVHAAAGCILFCMRKEQKVIPASAIKEAVEEKVASLEQELGRNIYRKEKQSIKDDLVATMLPNAFARSSHIRAYFDIKRRLLVIDASSAAQVDEFYELLLQTIGSFGAIQLVGDENPSQLLNQWILKHPPKGWSLSGEYLLNDLNDERIARFKDYEAGNPFVVDLLADGYTVKRLGITYKEQLKAVIQDDLQIKSIKFNDELLKDNDELKGEDEVVKFDADFALMTSSLADFIGDLIELFAPTQGLESTL